MIDCAALIILAATIFTAQASPPTQTTAPGPIYTAKDPGVARPKLKRQVKPQYTSDALANKVEGTVLLEAVVEVDGTVSDVDVVRSLDTGLDQEAMKALSQWQFAPATKDGVAVRMKVSVDMAFSISRPVFSMPAAFAPSTAGVANDGSAHWTEEQLEVDGLHISLARPAAWASNPTTMFPLDLREAGSLGTLRVEIPQPVRASRDLSRALSAAEIRQVAERVRERVSGAGHGALTESASGQAAIGTRLWLWFDGSTGGEHVWDFVTTEQGREVSCTFSLTMHADASDDERRSETAAAGAEFLTILKRISIELKPE